MNSKSAFYTFIFFALVFLLGYFIVQNLNKADEDSVNFSNLRVCSYVRQNQPCENHMSSMERDVQDIYATVWVNNLEADEIEVKWYYVTDGLESEIGTAQEEVFDSGVLQFKLEKDYAKGWLVGDYKVEVKLDGKLEKESREFEIIEEF